MRLVFERALKALIFHVFVNRFIYAAAFFTARSARALEPAYTSPRSIYFGVSVVLLRQSHCVASLIRLRRAVDVVTTNYIYHCRCLQLRTPNSGCCCSVVAVDVGFAVGEIVCS